MRRFRNVSLTILFTLFVLEILIIAPKKLGQRHLSDNEVAMRRAQVMQKMGKASKDFKPSDLSPQVSEQTMKGVHLVEASGGEKEWELDSDVAQGFKEGIWKLQGVRVNLFGKNNSNYHVTGDAGVVSTQTKDIEILGNVVTTNTEGYIFKSPSMKYNSTKKELNTPGEVQVIGPKKNGEFFEFEGKGFAADMNTSIMKIDENVKAVKTVLDAKQVMNIRSVWCRVHGKSNEAHFEKDVQVDIGTVRMTGEMADFIYDEQTKNLKTMLMQGGVKITDENRWATAEKVKVFFAENEFVLMGHPRVVQQDNELRGEEIHFLEGGKKVRVIRAKARLDAEEAGKNK